MSALERCALSAWARAIYEFTLILLRLRVVARAVERTRSLLLHYDALRIALRDARMDVHNLKDRLTVCASRGLEEGA